MYEQMKLQEKLKFQTFIFSTNIKNFRINILRKWIIDYI